MLAGATTIVAVDLDPRKLDTIIVSIREQLLTLPPETVVHTGHGESTTIDEEAPHLAEWLARGH